MYKAYKELYEATRECIFLLIERYPTLEKCKLKNLNNNYEIKEKTIRDKKKSIGTYYHS